MTEKRTTEATAEGITFDDADTTRIARDPELLRRFYLAHYDEVVRYLARRVTEPQDVADLVAETFLTAVEAARGFDHERGRALPWLIGIAHNKLRSFRRQRRSDHLAMQRVHGHRALDADDIAELEERIDAEARGARAMGLLERLTPAQRELVELVELQGLTPAEAATVVGVPAGVARIRLHRARRALRTAFDKGEMT